LNSAVEVSDLSHQYGDRHALKQINFAVQKGQSFGLVGPNGGGKSTTFKILSTLLRPTSGTAKVFGHDVVREPHLVRKKIGVVFQSPALDKKLTVEENLIYQAKLFGLKGTVRSGKVTEILKRIGLLERRKEMAEKLSGGLQRRLEIGKALLHQPELLILDEPTVGLDPLARREVWEYLRRLREVEGVTLLLTTHLLEEADHCHQIALLHEGQIVALGEPQALKETVGGDVLSIRCQDAERILPDMQATLERKAKLVDGMIRVEMDRAFEVIPKLMAQYGDKIQSMTVGKPTLEDLFIQKTGHRFWKELQE